MPIDYDKIVEGRRRNWESLKPEEIREKEREVEKERAKKEREEKGQEGFYARRQRLRDESTAAERARFRKALRQTGVMLCIFLLIGGAWVGVSHFIKTQRAAALQRSLITVQQSVEKGTPVVDMKTPVMAFGTWRSAWKRGDMTTVVRLLSPRMIGKTSEAKSPGDILVEYQRLYRDGRLDSVKEYAEYFAVATPVRIPLPPYRNEELAIFKSGPVEKFGEKGAGKQYVVSFSYSKADKNWHFADVRETKYFSVKWYMEAMIRPLRVGPGAMTFTETGDAIQNPLPASRTSGNRGAKQQQPAKRPPPVTLK